MEITLKKAYDELNEEDKKIFLLMVQRAYKWSGTTIGITCIKELKNAFSFLYEKTGIDFEVYC